MRKVDYFTRIFIAVSSLLLCPARQVGATDPKPPATVHSSRDPFLAHDPSPWDESCYEEQEFTQRFNELVFALQSFSETYNSGHVIDVKRVKAIKKAWRELEKSDWFKPDNAQ